VGVLWSWRTAVLHQADFTTYAAALASSKASKLRWQRIALIARESHRHLPEHLRDLSSSGRVLMHRGDYAPSNRARPVTLVEMGRIFHFNHLKSPGQFVVRSYFFNAPEFPGYLVRFLSTKI
jgi:hypothetical protein